MLCAKHAAGHGSCRLFLPLVAGNTPLAKPALARAHALTLKCTSPLDWSRQMMLITLDSCLGWCSPAPSSAIVVLLLCRSVCAVPAIGGARGLWARCCFLLECLVVAVVVCAQRLQFRRRCKRFESGCLCFATYAARRTLDRDTKCAPPSLTS